MELTPEVAEYIGSITDEDAMREFQNANMDRFLKPTELLATSKWSELMCRQLNLPPLLMTMHLYSLGHVRRFLEHAQNAADGKDQEGNPVDNGIYTYDHKLGAIRMGLVGADIMSKMVARAAKMAPMAQPSKIAKPPKNAPPNSDGIPPTLIQNNAGGTVVVK